MFTFPRLDTFISYGNRFSTRLLIYRTLWHHNKIIFRFWLISTISLVSIDLKKTTENQLIARWMIQMVFHLCTRVALDIRLLIIKYNQYFVSRSCGVTRTIDLIKNTWILGWLTDVSWEWKGLNFNIYSTSMHGNWISYAEKFLLLLTPISIER